jgi:hypothetical protein
MFQELRFAATIMLMVTYVTFTVPITFTAGINVAQKIRLVECITPQVQNTKTTKPGN